MNKNVCSFLLTVFLILCSLNYSFAVPAAPVTQELIQPDGSVIHARQWGDEWSHGWETSDGYSIAFDKISKKWSYATRDNGGRLIASSRIVKKGQRPANIKKLLRPAVVSPAPRIGVSGMLTVGAPGMAPPLIGIANIPVILINFDDTTTSYNVADFDSLLFGTGNKSMKDYYEEVSYGAFSVSAGPGGVAGWYTSIEPHDYYGTTSVEAKILVREAVAAADATFDYAPYDQDGDCYVDVIDIIHQGAGEEASGLSGDIWSHRSNLGTSEYTTNDPCPSGGFIIVNDYVIQPETLYGQMHTVGVFVHEYAHALGFPDLYDVDSSSAGIGYWGLMASGVWNQTIRSGDTPAHMSAWSKAFAGWVTPAQVMGDLIDEPLDQAATTADAYQLFTGNEYFLIENRQLSGFDAGLPGAGLLIWHIDEAMTSNNQECHPPSNCTWTHYKVSLEQADGLWDLEKGLDYGDIGDPFPGSTVNISFTDTSLPDSKLYDSSTSGLNVINISASGPTMYFTISSCTDNDGDGYGNPGSSLCINGPTTDCDDTNENVNPATFWYQDFDGDGYGNPAVPLQQCTQQAGYVLDSTDCDDTDPNLFPEIWYQDNDGDGYGNPSVSLQQCGQPAGYVSDNTDCDDTDINITVPPCSAVLVDNGDGTITDTTTNLMWLKDANYAATSGYFAYGADAGGIGMSWDDAVIWASTLNFAGYQDWRLPSGTNPDGTGPFTGLFTAGGTGELVHLGYYNTLPGPFTNLHPTSVYWTGTEFALDNDSAYSSLPLGTSSQSIIWRKMTVVGPDQLMPTRKGAWAVRDINVAPPSCTDNDGDGYGNPGFHLCLNGAATDCDDTNINIHPATIWYQDSDGDGYGNAVATLQQCAQPAGYVLDNTDCDDTDINIHPATIWYQDSDGDTYGDPAFPLLQCAQPAGYVLNSDDCDDTNAGITVASFWYLDADLDSYGDPAFYFQQCLQPSGYYVQNSDDCNDADALINISTNWFPDADEDGYGNPTISLQMCIAPEGYILDNSDCNDNDSMINPNGPAVRIMGAEPVYYEILSEALAEPQPGDVINVKAETFAVDLIIDTPDVSLTIEGGYDCGYYAATGFTTLIGNLTIINGTLTLGHFIIQ